MSLIADRVDPEVLAANRSRLYPQLPQLAVALNSKLSAMGFDTDSVSSERDFIDAIYGSGGDLDLAAQWLIEAGCFTKRDPTRIYG